MKDYSGLQNGSDIRGIAIGLPGGPAVNLTESACRDIGRGFALWLTERFGKKKLRVALGRDCRLSGESMLRWLGEELEREGMAVTDMGGATTPAMFMTTVLPGYEFDASVMVTASHLPMERNGYKFFTAGGGLESGDIRAILAHAASDAHTGLPAGDHASGGIISAYAASLREKIRTATGLERPFEGLRLIVDAGNGMGGFYEREVLKPLGADTAGSVYLDPDGRFPNHIPNPENAGAMESIRSAVLSSKADFGLIFDTDVDRAGAVLPDGSELNRNRLIAALSAVVLRDVPGATIVTDSVTSSGLAAFIVKHGGIHRRFRRGYRNVINEAVRLTAAGQTAPLAMETSGHGALQENWYLDDGAYLMTRLLIELVRCRQQGETLETLISDLAEPAEAKEFRLSIAAENFRSYGQSVIDALTAYCAAQPGWTPEAENCEGIRVNLDRDHGDGWLLLRLSLHEPLLPLNLESDSKGGVKTMTKELLPFLRQFDQLGLDAMEKFAAE